MPESALRTIVPELLEEIRNRIPDPTQFQSLISEEIHIGPTGVLITRSYQTRDDNTGVLYVRGLLESLTISLEIDLSFRDDTFVVLIKIDNPLPPSEYALEYKNINGKMVQVLSALGGVAPVGRFILCVIKCGGLPITVSLGGCAHLFGDKNSFIACVLSGLSDAGVTLAGCIINCI
jgi:hypothetical protein